MTTIKLTGTDRRTDRQTDPQTDGQDHVLSQADALIKDICFLKKSMLMSIIKE